MKRNQEFLNWLDEWFKGLKPATFKDLKIVRANGLFSTVGTLLRRASSFIFSCFSKPSRSLL